MDKLKDYPVVISVPVQWGDQDSFRHVNNVKYIRWFESARIAYAERIGVWSLYDEEKIGLILASISCNYRRPVNYPDTVRVGSRISRIGRSSVTMEHKVLNGDGDVVADGDSVVVVYDYNHGKPYPLRQNMRAAISELEGKSF